MPGISSGPPWPPPALVPPHPATLPRWKLAPGFPDPWPARYPRPVAPLAPAVAATPGSNVHTSRASPYSRTSRAPRRLAPAVSLPWIVVPPHLLRHFQHRQRLPILHVRADIDVNCLDIPRHFRVDVHVLKGLERSSQGQRRSQLPSRHGHHSGNRFAVAFLLVLGAVGLCLPMLPANPQHSQRQQGSARDQNLHLL